MKHSIVRCERKYSKDISFMQKELCGQIEHLILDDRMPDCHSGTWA